MSFVSIVYRVELKLLCDSGGLQAVRRLWEAKSLLWANARPHTLQTYGFSPEIKKFEERSNGEIKNPIQHTGVGTDVDD